MERSWLDRYGWTIPTATAVVVFVLALLCGGGCSNIAGPANDVAPADSLGVWTGVNWQ